MTYSVKEIFYTLQGEGANTGRPAVFCRFTGCNLWSGRETDRKNAICKFCDTDFVGTDGVNGGKFRTAKALACEIARIWGKGDMGRFVVFTGGEPLLQLDEKLIAEVKKFDFEIAVETNGTLKVPSGVDWLCVSPKYGGELVVVTGDELKLVFPQRGVTPEDFEHLNFGRFYLQPMDGEHLAENTQGAIRYCLENPLWRLSIQSHKVVGIP